MYPSNRILEFQHCPGSSPGYSGNTHKYCAPALPVRWRGRHRRRWSGRVRGCNIGFGGSRTLSLHPPIQRLVVYTITPVAEGLFRAEGLCKRTGRWQQLAPAIVGIFYYCWASFVNQLDYITLSVAEVVVICSIIVYATTCPGSCKADASVNSWSAVWRSPYCRFCCKYLFSFAFSLVGFANSQLTFQ